MKNPRAAKELGEFQAEETFHRREWLVQRIGWTLMFLLIVAGCLGLLGNGPLAQQTLVSRAGVVEIDRFARREAATQWIITPKTSASGKDTFTVRFSSSFLKRYDISTIEPEPLATRLDGAQVVMEFGVSGLGGDIVFHAEPQHAGMGAGEVQLGDSEPLQVKQFIYP